MYMPNLVAMGAVAWILYTAETDKQTHMIAPLYIRCVACYFKMKLTLRVYHTSIAISTQAV